MARNEAWSGYSAEVMTKDKYENVNLEWHWKLFVYVGIRPVTVLTLKSEMDSSRFKNRSSVSLLHYNR